MLLVAAWASSLATLNWMFLTVVVGMFAVLFLVRSCFLRDGNCETRSNNFSKNRRLVHLSSIKYSLNLVHLSRDRYHENPSVQPNDESA
jgi:hypothetical protein